MVRYSFIFLVVGTLGFAQTQTMTTSNIHLDHALLTHQSGKLIVQTDSPRPVEQALAELRREYGIVLDYEEGPSDDPSRVGVVANRRRWIGGSYTISVKEPASSSFADSKKFIDDVLTQFSTSGSRQFTTISGANDRITVSPPSSTERILDTPIVLQPANRTIDQTIEAILAAVSQKTGKTFVRGGLIDNELASKYVTIGNVTPIAARILLAQALDSVPYRKFWIQGWDPSNDTYAILIQTVVKTEITMNGAVREIPIHK